MVRRVVFNSTAALDRQGMARRCMSPSEVMAFDGGSLCDELMLSAWLAW
jgi:hypothetical protein